MTAFTFRPAIRENVSLLIGLAGETGSGKTYSALQLATGLAGDKPFAFIDTENKRGLHYADQFKFDHAEIRPPFRPGSYLDALEAAQKAGYRVVVVDSASHEHAGEGGLLDWHEELLTKFAGDDWKKREANNMRAWIEPKMEHKKFVQGFLQLNMHIIFCFRAEAKVEMVKVDGKTKIVPKESPVGADGFMPVCEKNLPYEMTVSFLMRAERPGYPIPIKLQEQHRALFPLDKPISKASGEAVARWAAGGQPKTAPPALSSILTAIRIAENLAQLDAVKASAALLEGEDKAKATAAFKAKRDSFQKS